MTEKLIVKNLVKEYDGEQVLKSLSFVVKEGEFLSVLGPSGCGKTTLLRIPHRSGIPDRRRNTAGRKRHKQASRIPERNGNHIPKLCLIPQYDSSGKRRVCPEDQT